MISFIVDSFLQSFYFGFLKKKEKMKTKMILRSKNRPVERCAACKVRFEFLKTWFSRWNPIDSSKIIFVSLEYKRIFWVCSITLECSIDWIKWISRSRCWDWIFLFNCWFSASRVWNQCSKKKKEISKFIEKFYSNFISFAETFDFQK